MWQGAVHPASCSREEMRESSQRATHKIRELQKAQGVQLQRMISDAILAEQDRAAEYELVRSSGEWDSLERRFAAEREDEKTQIASHMAKCHNQVARLKRKPPQKYQCARCGAEMWHTRRRQHDLHHCSDRLLPCVHYGCSELVRPSERAEHERVCKVVLKTKKLLKNVKTLSVLTSSASHERVIKCPDCNEQFPANLKSALREHMDKECKNRWIICPHANCSARIRACDQQAHDQSDCRSTWCKLRRKLHEKDRAKQKAEEDSLFESVSAKMGLDAEEVAMMLKMRKALQLLIADSPR